MLADLFQIEMLQTTVSRIMKKNQDLRFVAGLSVYFVIMASKNLQNSSAIQNNSITLLSVIIAIIVCNPL